MKWTINHQDKQSEVHPVEAYLGHTIATWNVDGTRLVTTATDGKAEIWDAKMRNMFVALPAHRDVVWQATWSADGSRILTAGWDGIVRICNAEKGTELAVTFAHTGPVLQANWNTDEGYVLTVGWDGTAKIWDAKTETELFTLSNPAKIWQARWNTNGSRILTIGQDGSVYQWYTHMEDLLNAACQQVPRNMNVGEWQRFMGNDPYRETCPGKPVLD